MTIPSLYAISGQQIINGTSMPINSGAFVRLGVPVTGGHCYAIGESVHVVLDVLVADLIHLARLRGEFGGAWVICDGFGSLDCIVGAIDRNRMRPGRFTGAKILTHGNCAN